MAGEPRSAELDESDTRSTVKTVEPFDAMFSEDPVFAGRLSRLARGWDHSSEVASTINLFCQSRRLVHTTTVTFDVNEAEAAFGIGNYDIICGGLLRPHSRELTSAAACEGVELRLCELAPRAGGWTLSTTVALIGSPIPHRRLDLDCRRLTLVY